MTFDDYLAHRLGVLLRFATVVTCDPHLAEDVVQDVLARAHGRWVSIAALEHPEAYLKRMVVNEFISWGRRRSRAVPVSPEIIASRSPHQPDHAAGYGERDALMRRIAGLPPKQRAVVALRYYDGCSDAEIAATLGCSEGTVRTHASRALATMRAAMTGPTGGRGGRNDY